MDLGLPIALYFGVHKNRPKPNTSPWPRQLRDIAHEWEDTTRAPTGKRCAQLHGSPANSRKKARTSRPPPPPSPPPPPPHADVTVAPRDPRIAQWRAFPLPDEEELFLDALHAARGRDFSPLEAWMAEPPFADDNDDRDPHDLAYLNYTHNLKTALHG
ncbi:hypothetical protein B0H11DRAFT_2225359, partial [Mycena galericulata]